MNGNLRIEKVQNGSNLNLLLQGQIDEGADYSNISFTGCKTIAFDFEKVTLINSTGLQKWISFLEKVPLSIEIKFIKCPLRITNQINLFPGFLANRTVKIESFYAPYYCPDCNRSDDVLLVTESHFKDKNNIRAPEMNCKQCHKTMEFDGIEKKFFLFLKR